MSNRLLAFVVAFASLLTACSNGVSTNVSPHVPQVSRVSGPIKSEQALRIYLSAEPSNSPLNFLSAPARGRFLSSLQFNQRGLTTYRYDDLSALPVAHMNAILNLFGMVGDSDMIASLSGRRPAIALPVNGNGDYPNYECASRATCAPATSLICTHNC